MADAALSCRKASELLSRAYDRPLRDDEVEALRHHLDLCLRCRNFGKQLEVIDRAAKRFAAGKPPPKA